MTLKQLRYFIEVCQQQNMTKAASILHVAQPSISVAIKELEQELGVNIFHRMNHQLSLTTEGEYFYERLKVILNELDALVNDVKVKGNHNNKIRIGVPPMMGSFLFPQIFSKLKGINPKLQFDITECGALEIQKILHEGEIDLALFISESIVDSNIRFKPIIKTNLTVVVHPDNPLAQRKSLNLNELKNEPLILFGKGFYLNQIIMNYFSDHQIIPNIVLETERIHTIKRFIFEGLASSILIDESVSEQDNLVKIPIKDLPTLTIALIWKKDHLLSKETQQIIDQDFNTLF